MQVVREGLRLQSAMEYLMTYGWAILIIAVVITALFQIGAFTHVRGSLVCLANPTFLCGSPTLSSSGALTVNLGYNGNNYPITITGLSCNVTSAQSPPSVETTRVTMQPGQTINLVFQCPLTNGQVGSGIQVRLYIYYDTPTVSGQQTEIAKGVAVISYPGLIWNVTEWEVMNNNVNLLAYSNVQSNPEHPIGTNVIGTGKWTSSVYKNIAGWSFSTDYHMHDVYNGIETVLFPLTPLSLDTVPCSFPYDSRGYTAISDLFFNGQYTLGTWTDDGTQIFYRPVSGGSWTEVLPSASSWTGQPPHYYASTINFAPGDYEVVVDYIDTCDPAGLSTIVITPVPSQG